MQLPYNNIFITGSTGVLGSYVLKYLLENTDAQIHCLIRAKNKTHALNRQIYAMMPYGLSIESLQALKERTFFYLGDITAEQFGWTQSTWDNLASQIDCSIHIAATLNFLSSYKALYDANVLPMSTVKNFVRACKNPLLAYVSSYSVRGHLKNAPFTEQDCDVGQSFENMPYPQSKFEAEQWLRKNTGNEIQYIIFRPGNIFGESFSGRYPFYQNNSADVFYNILKTMIDTNKGPALDLLFDITPIDYVTQAMLFLLGEKAALYQTFHLVNPTILPMKAIWDILNQLGYPINIISSDDYVHAIRTNTLFANDLPYHSMTLELMKVYEQLIFTDYETQVSSDLTQKMLKHTSIRSKTVLELLPIYVKYCEKIGYISTQNTEKLSIL